MRKGLVLIILLRDLRLSQNAALRGGFSMPLYVLGFPCYCPIQYDNDNKKQVLS